MTLHSVKVFDKNNAELNSTVSVSVSNDQSFNDLIPLLGRLAREETQQGQAQGLIINNQLIVFRTTINDLILVSNATINTSFQSLELFLELLDEYLRVHIPTYEDMVSTKHFQDICNSIVKTVDDSNTELKIALLGLDRSGKTTFVNFLKEDQPLAGFESYQPTQLLNIIRIDISNLPQLQFYDLGYAYQQQWWRFSSESDGYIFFVDSSDPDRIKKSQELLQEIRNFWDRPFVVAANMRDTSGIVNIRKYLARKFRISSRKIYETDTWTGDGILPLLEGLVKHEIQGKKIAVSMVPSK
ncbi:MAG: ADP-ribosylation factor-like protein [Candidatus Hodarchaeales archaeon]